MTSALSLKEVKLCDLKRIFTRQQEMWTQVSADADGVISDGLERLWRHMRLLAQGQDISMGTQNSNTPARKLHISLAEAVSSGQSSLGSNPVDR